MMGHGDIDAADAYCRSLAARHYENFSVTSHLLPMRLRRDLNRVYAYCRTTDDLGDESGAEALPRLRRWHAEVAELFAGEIPMHPVLLALRESIREHALPSEPFFALIAANVQDQAVTTYESWPELEAYCRLSAAPVGRMVLGVFGLSGTTAEQLSDDICIGLQLANFAQDVARDAALGRTYLVQSDLRAFGTPGATRVMCERARARLASGRRLEAMAPALLRIQLALYRLGGLAICAAIERSGYDTRSRRPQVSKFAKVGLVARAGLGAIRTESA